MISNMDPAVWEVARSDLEATALVREERDLLFGGRPYLRFHPTLTYAVSEGESNTEMRKRFINAYVAVTETMDKALKESDSRDGMEGMEREEANFRTAISWAVEQKLHKEAVTIGNTLRDYFERTGPLQERDRWVIWLADEVRKDGFRRAVAVSKIDEAWSLFAQGHPEEAIANLEALVARLKNTSEFDPAFDLALACSQLGRVYDSVGWSQKAFSLLMDAASQWEVLENKARKDGKSADKERGNLAATLGDLTNIFIEAGQLGKAMGTNARAIKICREIGYHHDLVSGLGRLAEILTIQGRYSEADDQYEEALQAAQHAGDRNLEGSMLQHRGILAEKMKHYDRAAKLYQCALNVFQNLQDEGSVMRTCNLLGLVEQNSGRLAEARAWYERSRELAEHRGDRKIIGIASQNLGIVYQKEGETARERGDEATARERFVKAVRFVGENLQTCIEIQHEPGEAASHGQLGQIHFLLGNLDQAEEHTHRARRTCERLGLKEVHRAYHTLAQIASARQNEAQAASWERKRDDLLDELARRAQGVSTPSSIPPRPLIHRLRSGRFRRRNIRSRG